MSKAAKTPPPAKAGTKPTAKSAGRGKPALRESRLDAQEHAYPKPARNKHGASVKEPSPLQAYNNAPATLNGYVAYLRSASPLQRVEAEREGVPAQVVKHMATSMDLSAVRMFNILGIAKATAESKAAQHARITGASGQAALGVMHLLGIAEAMLKDSTAPDARDFDWAKWLGSWIEQPQAALGGQKPADLLDTPTGLSVVARLLGSLESGAYQ
ncbi:antitoxin Xre/MbcA/ParS toxin-binding domain-containing protein [Lysobacter gummosus]|jgi:putative toxin-antitoxin system antitoxin component (TIGR02293 family)|uniref:antitoxin Xre/MbcA/ParS toxin-binding domain-containing protein n=1 Tax=Lysobacter gummosus TaxID=262324 RepID=UPI003634A3E6